MEQPSVLDSAKASGQPMGPCRGHLDNTVREVYRIRPINGDVGARGSVADSCDPSVSLGDPE